MPVFNTKIIALFGINGIIEPDRIAVLWILSISIRSFYTEASHETTAPTIPDGSRHSIRVGNSVFVCRFIHPDTAGQRQLVLTIGHSTPFCRRFEDRSQFHWFGKLSGEYQLHWWIAASISRAAEPLTKKCWFFRSLHRNPSRMVHLVIIRGQPYLFSSDHPVAFPRPSIALSGIRIADFRPDR